MGAFLLSRYFTMQQVLLFLANQMYKLFGTERLVKIGVNTVFTKDRNNTYEFGGKIYAENEDMVLFYGLPKRIEIHGDNVTALIEYEHNDLLGVCCELRQDKTCEFDENYFIYQGVKYYDIRDLYKFV